MLTGYLSGCFRPYKYTNFKAIHNTLLVRHCKVGVVFDPTNIQILKQFTTVGVNLSAKQRLFSTLQIYKF